MTATRDFLEGTIPPTPFDLSILTDTIGLQNALLRDIRRELYKQNPSVLCQTIVQNSTQNQITDTGNHQVKFELGGKPVTVYRLVIFSSYDVNITFSFASLANDNDGLIFQAGNLLNLDVAISECYVSLASLSGTGCFINGPSDPTHGGFFILGWTIPDFDKEVGR